MKNYEPKKDLNFGLLFFACPLFTWFLMLIVQNFFLFCIATAITLLFVWIWFGTIYKTDEKFISYKSGPFRGKVPIAEIKEIKANVTSWIGMRPALSFKYLKIRYNNYNELFIAPRNSIDFIEDIKMKNSNVIVS